jgi:DNA polymerase-3 subunit beta
MKTEFPTTRMAAVAHFMADLDVRYYLKGVFVEALSTETRLVATDGCAAAVARHAIENTESFAVIVPRDVVLMAAKMKQELIALECDAGGVWSLGGIRFTPVDAHFPDYRRIFPGTVSGEPGYYGTDYLARLAKAGKSLKFRSNPIVRQNGTGVAVCHFYGFDDFVAAIAPLRMFTEKMPDLGMPTWAAARNK